MAVVRGVMYFHVVQFTKYVYDTVVTNFKVLCENLMMTIQMKCIERNCSRATVYYT